MRRLNAIKVNLELELHKFVIRFTYLYKCQEDITTVHTAEISPGTLIYLLLKCLNSVANLKVTTSYFNFV